MSMPASRAGKAKTFSQVSAVGLTIAPLPSSYDAFVLAVVVAAVVLTVLSGHRVPVHPAASRGDGVRAEVIAVGTELLLGQIANTNARWMSERLAAIGADVLHHQAVGDNLDRIVEAIASWPRRGPTW